MSTYDLAFPDPTRVGRASILLTVLGLHPGGIRLRDTWAELVGDDLRIAVYTRLGGGNRDDYAGAIADLQAHPHYLSDRDDGFDSTYATFRFRWDEAAATEMTEGAELPEPLTGIVTRAAHVGEVDTDERWRAAIARIESGEVTPGQLAGFDQVVSALRDAINGDGPPIIRV